MNCNFVSEITAPKSCEAFWLLHSRRRETSRLRIHAKQKLELLHFRSAYNLDSLFDSRLYWNNLPSSFEKMVLDLEKWQKTM